MMRRTVVSAALALGVVACAGANKAPAGGAPDGLGGRGSFPAIAAMDAGTTKHHDGSAADPPVSPKDAKNIARMLQHMSEIRGIRSTKAVPGVKLSRMDMVARIKEKALRE